MGPHLANPISLDVIEELARTLGYEVESVTMDKYGSKSRRTKLIKIRKRKDHIKFSKRYAEILSDVETKSLNQNVGDALDGRFKEERESPFENVPPPLDLDRTLQQKRESRDITEQQA